MVNGQFTDFSDGADARVSQDDRDSPHARRFVKTRGASAEAIRQMIQQKTAGYRLRFKCGGLNITNCHSGPESGFYGFTMLFIKRTPPSLHFVERRMRAYLFRKSFDGDLPDFTDQTRARMGQ